MRGAPPARLPTNPPCRSRHPSRLFLFSPCVSVAVLVVSVGHRSAWLPGEQLRLPLSRNSFAYLFRERGRRDQDWTLRESNPGCTSLIVAECGLS